MVKVTEELVHSQSLDKTLEQCGECQKQRAGAVSEG